MVKALRSLLNQVFPVAAMLGLLLAGYRLLHTPDEILNATPFGAGLSPISNSQFSTPAPLPSNSMVAQQAIYYQELRVDTSPRMTVQPDIVRKARRRPRSRL